MTENDNVVEFGHNSDQQEAAAKQVLFKTMRDINKINVEIASLNAEKREVFRGAKEYGFSKNDIKFAIDLGKKSDEEIVAEYRQKQIIAKAIKHPLGSQMSLFEDKRTLSQLAYDRGFAIGCQGGDSSNLYDEGSEDGQHWQRGFNDGHSEANKDLSLTEELVKRKEAGEFTN